MSKPKVVSAKVDPIQYAWQCCNRGAHFPPALARSAVEDEAYEFDMPADADLREE